MSIMQPPDGGPPIPDREPSFIDQLNADGAATDAPGRDRPSFRTLADFEVRPVEWLWYGRLARGKVTLVDGDPGDNKSTFGLDLAARLTTGRPLPTFTGPEPAPTSPQWVAIMTAEDDPGDTVRPRFEAAGGDPAHAAWVPSSRPMWNETAAMMVEVPTSLPADLDVVREVVEATGAELLIVDPLSAYIGSVDAHRDNEVRAAIRPLADLAAELGFAVLAVRHFTKSGAGRAMHRGGGSVAFIGAARVGLTVVRDPDDDAARLLSVSKCNLAPEQPTLRYRIGTDPDRDQPVVEWVGTDERSADDVLRDAGSDADERSDQDDAADWLRHYLATEGGEAQAGDVLKAGDRDGFAKHTLQRARRRAGVVTRKSGLRSGWVWALPTASEGDSGPPEGDEGDKGSRLQSSSPSASPSGYRDCADCGRRTFGDRCRDCAEAAA